MQTLQTQLRRKFSLILLLLFGGLAGLAILEIGLRFLPPPPVTFESYGDTYTCSPTLGWRGRANYQGVITRSEYSHPIRFNAQGMYDTDHTFEKPDHVFRILWVGDSFAQALQVAETETAHQQLENLLNERLGSPTQQFEVVSAGVIGWGNGQELVYYREEGRQYDPDLVLLLFFMGNDVNDNLPGHALTIDGFNCFAPYFPVCDNKPDPQSWDHIPGIEPAWEQCSPFRRRIAAGLSFFQQNTYLFARIEPLLLARTERRTYGQEFGLPFAALYLPEESAEVSYGWQVTEGILNHFNQAVQADDGRFGMVTIGPREVIWLSQLDEGQRQSFYQSDPAFRTAAIDRPNRRLADFLTIQDIPHLDLQPAMIDYIAQTGAPLYLPIDRHWTVEGNRLAAEFIFTWLLDHNLVPADEVTR